MLQVPKVNKLIWENLSTLTRQKEGKLQGVQRDILTIAIPVSKTLEMIYNAKDYMASLDAKELIDTVKDSFIFLGSVEVDKFSQIGLFTFGTCKNSIFFGRR